MASVFDTLFSRLRGGIQVYCTNFNSQIKNKSELKCVRFFQAIQEMVRIFFLQMASIFGTLLSRLREGIQVYILGIVYSSFRDRLQLFLDIVYSSFQGSSIVLFRDRLQFFLRIVYSSFQGSSIVLSRDRLQLF